MRQLFRAFSAISLILLSLLSLHSSADAGDAEDTKLQGWPGLWGPNRNARIEASLKVEPGAQVKQIWRQPIGRGFSEVVVIAGRGYATFSDGKVDQLMAFDLETGQEIWRSGLGPTHFARSGSDDGPIATPVVSQQRIFVLDPWGKLFAFELATGRPLWQFDLKTQLGVEAPFWGFASTPLAVGKVLVVQAGGAERHNLVAVDPANGKIVWSSQPAKQNGYSSPVLMTLAGVPQVVAATTDKIFGVNPEDGSILWSHPALGEPRQSPILLPDNRLFVTCWQESAMLEVTTEGGSWKVREIWRKPVLKSTYSPSLFHQGFLYGMNGTYINCLDAKTGEIKWREKIYNATMILVGDHLAVVGEQSGYFHLVEATPVGFKEKLKAPVFTPGARSMTGPMFLGGRRFLLRNMEEMVLLELVPGQTAATPAGKDGL